MRKRLSSTRFWFVREFNVRRRGWALEPFPVRAVSRFPRILPFPSIHTTGGDEVLPDRLWKFLPRTSRGLGAYPMPASAAPNRQNPLRGKGCQWSGWPDLNRRPLDPQSTGGLDGWCQAMTSCQRKPGVTGDMVPGGVWVFHFVLPGSSVDRRHIGASPGFEGSCYQRWFGRCTPGKTGATHLSLAAPNPGSDTRDDRGWISDS